MLDINSAEEGGDIVPLNKVDDLIENESFVKRRKWHIIIGIAIILVIVLVVVLCVCLIGKSKKSEDSHNTPDIIFNSKNNITLNVYSDSDDEEISLFSNEFNASEAFNMSENIIMYIDEVKYSFNKSMKLKKGDHKITYSFNDSLKSCKNMFKNCKRITKININLTNDCINTDYMFSGCSSLKSINIEKFDTSKVKNMEEMFSGCNSIENIDLNLLKTNSVNNMRRMFNGCKNLKSLDLHNLDTTYVTNMEEMFNECNSIKEIKFNEKTNYKFQSKRFIPFDTYNVENMYHIFYGCNSLQSIDVSNFVLYKLKNNISDLFGDLNQNKYFEEIYNNLTKIKNEENIIKDIDSNIVMEIKVTPLFDEKTNIFGFNFVDEQISESKMLIDNNTQVYDFSKNVNISLDEEHTIKILLEGNLDDVSYMFAHCKNMKIKFYKNFNDTKRKLFDKSNIMNMNSMFYYASNIEIDLSFFNSKKVKDMGSMFAYSSNLNLSNLTFFITDSVQNMSQMFRKSDFSLLDLSLLNTSSVTDMSYMFYDREDNYIDLSNFNTESVKNMSYGKCFGYF